MTNGLSRYENWRRLLEEGELVRVLELVINELDALDARGTARYDKVQTRLFWILTVLVTLLVSLIGTGVLFGFGIAS